MNDKQKKADAHMLVARTTHSLCVAMGLTAICALIASVWPWA
jgi:hypothetical protein